MTLPDCLKRGSLGEIRFEGSSGAQLHDLVLA